jgi:transcriptional regulator with XRE-family HTH domain
MPKTPKRGSGRRSDYPLSGQDGKAAPVAVGGPNPVDVHVGKRLRLRRTLLGMSQEKLGEAIGLTFQQVQKYERGANRIGSSRLYDLSRALGVSVAYFFEEMSDSVAAQSPAQVRGMAEDRIPYAYGDLRDQDPMTRRETLALVRAYYRIADPQVRKRLFEMIKALSAASSSEKSSPEK